MKFSNLKAEHIVWEDISEMTDSWAGQVDVEVWYKDQGEALVEQIGFVIFEDKHNVLVASSYIESMELYGGVHKIPKAVIRSRKKLSEENGDKD
jgi:hypothetical protein